MSTVLLELVFLALAGIVALVAWPFGHVLDPGLVALPASMGAVGPVAELYRAGRPPRGLAVVAAVAAVLAAAAVTLLVAVAVNWALSPPADPGVGLPVGYLVATPVGVAVLARFLGRTQAP